MELFSLIWEIEFDTVSDECVVTLSVSEARPVLAVSRCRQQCHVTTLSDTAHTPAAHMTRTGPTPGPLVHSLTHPPDTALCHTGKMITPPGWDIFSQHSWPGPVHVLTHGAATFLTHYWHQPTRVGTNYLLSFFSSRNLNGLGPGTLRPWWNDPGQNQNVSF